MKIFVDMHVFDGKYQGTRTYLEGLYLQMINHSNIDFYFAAYDVDNLKKIFGQKENVHYIKYISKNKIVRLCFILPVLLTKEKFDYAHFQYITPIIKRCKEIVTIHDLLFLDFPKYFHLSYRIKNYCLFKRAAKRADLLLTVSNYSKEEIIKFFKINANSIYVLPNGISSEKLQDDMNLDIKKKYGLDKFILCVSRIEPRKNHMLLLKSFVDLKLYMKGYKLVFIGAYDLKYTTFLNYYKKLSIDIRNNILMMSVPPKELIELYKNATLFVFPSFAEGFGIPPLEAILYECPTLCSRSTAMAEFKLPEKYYFDPSNIDELKNKMTYMLKNKDINEWRDLIEEKYNWLNISNKLYDILLEKECIK